MRHILEKAPDAVVPRLAKYGANVFGLDATLPPHEIAEKAIEATHDFFVSIGIPMTLREVGIDSSRIDEMARHVAENEGLENAWVPLDEADSPPSSAPACSRQNPSNSPVKIFLLA